MKITQNSINLAKCHKCDKLMKITRMCKIVSMEANCHCTKTSKVRGLSMDIPVVLAPYVQVLTALHTSEKQSTASTSCHQQGPAEDSEWAPWNVEWLKNNEDHLLALNWDSHQENLSDKTSSRILCVAGCPVHSRVKWVLARVQLRSSLVRCIL